MFFQNRSRLSSPPNNVVKIVESASRMSPAAFAFRRHPEEHVELAVTGLRERMRPRQVDRLLREHVNGRRVVVVIGVVRQMRMEVEGRARLRASRARRGRRA